MCEEDENEGNSKINQLTLKRKIGEHEDGSIFVRRIIGNKLGRRESDPPFLPLAVFAFFLLGFPVELFLSFLRFVVFSVCKG